MHVVRSIYRKYEFIFLSGQFFRDEVESVTMITLRYIKTIQHLASHETEINDLLVFFFIIVSRMAALYLKLKSFKATLPFLGNLLIISKTAPFVTWALR